MKKKLFALSLVLAVLMGLLPFPAGATVLASGQCGAAGYEVTWTLENTGEQSGLMTISGIGAMTDYAKITDVPWYAYVKQVESVVIGEGVTAVGKNAFQGCTNLKSATLSASLTSIGDAAFYQCGALETLTLPDGLTSIGKNAFGLCAFATIEIPKNVAEIGEGAFYKCAKLTAITVQEGNVKYSADAGVLFDYDKTTLICYPLSKSETEYTVPNTVKEVAPYAFYAASVESVTFQTVRNGGLEKIGERAFANDIVLKELVLPVSLTTVGDYAFYECTGLSDDVGNEIAGAQVAYSGSRQQWSNLTIGDGNSRMTNAKVIFTDMQQDNVLAKGECGASGNNAFWSVQKVKVRDDEGREQEETELLISGTGAMTDYSNATDVPWASYKDSDEDEPVDYRSQIQKLRVEEGITTLGDYTCNHCVELVSASLPQTLESIGDRAFSGCAKLADINPSLNPEEASVSLSETSLQSIGDYAFNSTALASVTFPETLLTIGDCAFLNCVSLTEIAIPFAVTEIGDWAFQKCAKLETFTMNPPETEEGTEEESHYMSLGAYALADCVALKTLSFTDNLTVIGDYALMNCTALESVDLPVSVTGIGNCVFRSCTHLEAVNVLAVVNKDGETKTVYEVDEDAEVLQENEAYCTKNAMLMNKDQTYILYYPANRASPACRIPEGVTNIASFAFETAYSLNTVSYEGSWSQWQEVNIGEHNDALLNIVKPRMDVLENPEENPGEDPTDSTQSFYCEKADLTGGDTTQVRFFTMQETEKQTETGTETERTIKADIHCGKEVEGAVAFCAMYDKNGRFLSMESLELVPGQDNPLSLKLVDAAVTVRLFVVDGHNLPQCKCEVYPPATES